ncbi:aminotransferase, class IV [Alkaliphilus metalliredigens QYMF]|uniref:Aminotransferase, class IV n=2 Tax=Alkaliphilus TaxID=114627 RepID=A6TQ50_ALKMQ|nr:aminotransferase, class IV [Alkaliphilus metalliredigens QYMF]
MYILMNGQLIGEGEGHLSPSGEALFYGYGLFETLKYHNKKIFFLREHLERLTLGCRKLDLQLKIEEALIEEWAYQLIQANQLPTGTLKITCIKSQDHVDVILSIRKNVYTNKDYEQGFKLCFTEVKRNPYSILTYIKSNNYLENLLVRKEALAQGYHEVVFTNVHGKICEGAISNIFFVREGILYTPAVECGILEGIMRNKILEIARGLDLRVEAGGYTEEDLLKAEEVFITNSLLEIMPVVEIEGKQFNLHKNIVTQTLRKQYEDYIGAQQ